MLPGIRQPVSAAWGPDSPHVPPPTPPPPPDGLAGMHPLEILLSRYPKINAPGVTNVSTRHMQGMAKRATTSAIHGSVLRDFLAGL